jgi:uncharacterized caspase-like protein
VHPDSTPYRARATGRFAAALATAALATAAPALAADGPLPDLIDAPLRTGARSPSDAAVVIGIEDYPWVEPVPFARRDAEAMYGFLVETRGIPASRVRKLTAGASREEMLAAIRAAGASVDGSGTVWVYFAGHGATFARDPGGEPEPLLLGADVRRSVDAFASRGVALSELREAARAGGGRAVLILDACFTGIGRGGAPLLPGARLLVPSYAAPASPDVVVWTAAGPDQVSRPLDAARHGAFTYLAVGALRGWADGALDGARDGQVTAAEAQEYVLGALRRLELDDQEPRLLVASGAPVVLATGVGEAAPALSRATSAAPSPAPAPQAPEAASWRPTFPSACACDGRLLLPAGTELRDLSKPARAALVDQARSVLRAEDWQEADLPAKVGGRTAGPRCPDEEFVRYDHVGFPGGGWNADGACPSGRSQYRACAERCPAPNACLVASEDGANRFRLLYSAIVPHCREGAP